MDSGLTDKPVLVETFISNLVVNVFDTRVLHRLARLNEMRVHPLLGSPGIQGRTGEFRTVVQNQISDRSVFQPVFGLCFVQVE